MNSAYQYRPVRFFVMVFAFTWAIWFAAAVAANSGISNISALMTILGLLVPPVAAMFTVMLSKSAALKRDLRHKLIGLFRVKPLIVFAAVVLFGMVVAVSILLSALFGQSLDQFAFTVDFSFAGGGLASLLVFLLAPLFEELGWRSYAQDSIAFYCSWWKATVIFGVVWSLWHLPAFFMPDTYHYVILQESPWYMLNFFVSVIPLSFLMTWVYVKNERSIFACMIYHYFVNFMQEKIAMTQTTKCVETLVLFLAASIVVMLNKDMFYETRHIGRLLPDIDS